MNHLLISSLAIADLQEIWQYIAQDSVEAADRVLDGLEQTFAQLLDAPLLGRSREELSPLLRSLVSGRYVIFYVSSEGQIEIARVLHGARDVQSAWSE